MDPILNPYAPGAGTPPPELAGRDEIREQARIATERIRRRRPAQSIMMVGLRGVGKTVLLDKIRDTAESRGFLTVRIEAPESRSLPALLAPQLRLTLLKLSNIERAKELAERGLRALAGFAEALKFKYQDIEVGLDFHPEPGLADNGDLEQDLSTLLEAVGAAAQMADVAVVMFVDELQYVRRGPTGNSNKCTASLRATSIADHVNWRRTSPVERAYGQSEVLRGTPIQISKSRCTGRGICCRRDCKAGARGKRAT